MYKAANTHWLDNRLQAQRVATRALPSFASPALDLSREIIGTRAEIRRRGGLVPSWVIFFTVILAIFALCVTVTMRAQAERIAASQKNQEITSQVETLRNSNAALTSEVKRLRNDPRAIERAAREHLKMARVNEIIVPIK